jgi:hypothetical protein
MKKLLLVFLLIFVGVVDAQKNNTKRYSLAVAVCYHEHSDTFGVFVDSIGRFGMYYIDSVNVCITDINGKMKTCHLTDTSGIVRDFASLPRKNIVTCTKIGYDTVTAILDLATPRDSTIILSITPSIASEYSGYGMNGNPLERTLTVPLHLLTRKKNKRSDIRYIVR